jgi:cytochrome P450
VIVLRYFDDLTEAQTSHVLGCAVGTVKSTMSQALARLRADPSLLSNAAAEIVRWQTPITHMRRTATKHVAFRGKSIREGDKVVIWYCSGNRDEQYFEDGNAFRIERTNAQRHIAFGSGIHR